MASSGMDTCSERGRVHEGRRVSVAVKEFHLLLFEAGVLELLLGPPAQLLKRALADVPQFRMDTPRHLSLAQMIGGLDDFQQVVAHLQDHARTQLRCKNHFRLVSQFGLLIWDLHYEPGLPAADRNPRSPYKDCEQLRAYNKRDRKSV